MKHYFTANGSYIEFIEEDPEGFETSERVLAFTQADAYELKASLEIAIEDLDHSVRQEKEELLASLRAKVEELEEHLASQVG